MGSLTFFVRGIPQPKGSGSKVAKGVYIEAGTSRTRKAKVAWYKTVADQAFVAMVKSGLRDPIGLPVEPEVVFFFPIPKTRLKGRRAISPGDPHASAPDCDKLQRAIGDSLTCSGVIKDDRQIWSWKARKVYSIPGKEGVYISLSW